MPKPRTLAREQRRLARDLARRQAIAAVEALITPAFGSPPIEAYQAEVARIVERMRFQYRLRAEPAHCSALAAGDHGGVNGPS